MTKVSLIDLANLENENTAVSGINANNAVIETAFDNTLSRDGTSPNNMAANLDMNSNRIINLPSAISQVEPVTLGQMVSALAANGNINVGTTEVPVSAAMQPVVAATTLDAAVALLPIGSPAMRPVINASTLNNALQLLNITPQRGLYKLNDGTLNNVVDGVNVLQYGAIGDGVNDDTAAFQSALNSQQNVYVPQGNFKLTSSIHFTAASQRMIGVGAYHSTLVPSFTGDCVTFTDGVRYQGMEHIGFFGPAHSGNCISASGSDRLSLKDLSFLTCDNGIYITKCNGAIVSDIYMDNLTGSYGIMWYGSSSARSDVLSLINVVMSGSNASGIIMDGNVNTLRMHAVGLTSMQYGLVTRNTSGGPPPAFIVAHDLEVDFPVNEAIYLSGGMRGGYFSNTYVQGSQTAYNININSDCYDFSFLGGVCSGAHRGGIYNAGRYLKVTGMNIYNNSQEGNNTDPGIFLAATSIGSTITGNHIGVYTGAVAENQNYGVITDTGAISYRIIGNDMSGNVTGAVLDVANDYSFSPTRSAVAFNGGSALNRLGSNTTIGLDATLDRLSFWNASPSSKLTVTGSRGGNSAVTSLLGTLSGYGLITDGTSA